MKKLMTVLVAGALLSGCAMNKTQKGALLGTAGGAAIGAAWGAARGDAAKGALIGAAVGGVGGAVTGAILDKQERELKAAGIQAQKTEDGNLLVTMAGESLKFDSAKSSLKPEGVAQVSKLSQILKKYPENQIIIEGHTDNVGKKADNQVLSQQRAEAVKSNMLGSGVPSGCIISVVGYGDSQPVADNKTADGKAQNRRVVLKITAPQEEAK